jgi:ADP-heptose:LPS heptosyltransferase
MLVESDIFITKPDNKLVLHSQTEPVKDIHKIAVLRANAIGDFIFSLPAIYALKGAYPQAEIALLGLEWHADFLRGRPGPIDRVVIIPPIRGINARLDTEVDSQEQSRFFEAMAEEHIDMAVQLHGGGRYSNPFVQRLGARITVGAKTPDAMPLDRWVPYVFYQSEVLRYLEIVSLVGTKPVILEPLVSVTEGDLAEVDHALPLDSRPLVALHPGAGDTRRQWPVEKFIAVGNSLAWAGARIAVIGTDREKEIVEAVVSGMNADAINLCNRLTLGGLAGLFSRCKVVVSNDSGPLHLAGAVGAATVGIYWCGNAITAGPLTTARHRTLLSWRLACPTCGLDCIRFDCGHRESFVADIPVKEVYSAALDLLFSEQT